MQERFRGGWKEWLLLISAAILFLLVLILPVAVALGMRLSADEQQLLRAYEQDEIIRLHVIAHSDSPYDQSVKLAVRDALIASFGDVLAASSAASSDEAYLALQTHLPDLLHTAQRCARELGFVGAVTAEAGRLHLPAKTYGQVTLPEGEYRALRITLGDGEGKNWWCVLYPQLCLALAGETGAAQEAQPVWNTAVILKNWLLKAE